MIVVYSTSGEHHSKWVADRSEPSATSTPRRNANSSLQPIDTANVVNVRSPQPIDTANVVNVRSPQPIDTANVVNVRSPQPIDTANGAPILIPSDNTNFEVLSVHRHHIFRDMIRHFRFENILTTNIKFQIIDARGENEKGEDLGGVHREVLTLFWNEFYNSCCLGQVEKVPTIRHDFTDEWTCAARVLVKGYMELGYLPVMLSHVFLHKVLSDDDLDQKSMLASYLNYIPTGDAKTIREVIDSPDEIDDELAEELLDSLSDLKARRIVVKPSLVKELVLELSHVALVQEPAFIANAWRDVFRGAVGDLNCQLKTALRNCKPTPRAVAKLLISNEEMDQKNQEHFDWLVKFVKDCDERLLRDFLRFCTGADVICVDGIKVTFNKLFGLNQRIVSHTCGCVLEVPVTYHSYLDFQNSFKNQLNSGFWEMDIV